MSPRPEDRIGDIIDRYRIERLLGTGGFGAVYAAQHLHMKRPVALKLLHREQLQGPKGQEMRDRFLREAQAAAAIGHPGIVQVYDSGVAGEDTFVVMELLEGEDLANYLRRERTVAASSAVAFGQRLLEAVGAAHKAGIVHRDLKPANIFLVGKAGGPVYQQPIKLLDFGISKVRGVGIEKITRTGMVMGTPHYMAPEMFLGASDVDERADLYAIGAILYQMLTACTPHNATSYENLVVQVATTPAPSLSTHRPDLPRGLVDVVDRSLRTNPAERHESAAAFAEALALSDKISPSMSKEDMLSETAYDTPNNAQPTNPAESGSRPPTKTPGLGDASENAPSPVRHRWLPVVAGAVLFGSLGAVWLMPSNPPVSATESPRADSANPPIPTAVDTATPATPSPVMAAEVADPPLMVAAPPAMTAMQTRRPVMSTMTTAPTDGVNTSGAPQGEERPGRIQAPCGPMYRPGPGTSIRVGSGRQAGITESSAVLRHTIQAQGPRILRCFGREPIPVGQGVNFHVGAGGVVTNVSLVPGCPIPPRVRRCLIGVFESIDFSSVQRGEGDAHIGFSAGG